MIARILAGYLQVPWRRPLPQPWRHAPLWVGLWLCAAGFCHASAPTTATLPRAAQSGDSPGVPTRTATAGNPGTIDPPLSLYESSQLLSQVLQVISGRQRSLPAAQVQQLDRILYAVILYVDRVDRAHPTLPFYAWEGVSSEKAPKDGWETQVFKLSAPIPQVTALSIRARHGDIQIKYLAATDQNKTKWEFNQNILVPADQPRPEICFLPLPTQLTEVRVTCRRTDPKLQRWGRLFIDAGISSVPESGKQARYDLQLARNALKNQRVNEAQKFIRQAHELLREYQKTRRL